MGVFEDWTLVQKNILSKPVKWSYEKWTALTRLQLIFVCPEYSTESVVALFSFSMCDADVSS